MLHRLIEIYNGRSFLFLPCVASFHIIPITSHLPSLLFLSIHLPEVKSHLHTGQYLGQVIKEEWSKQILCEYLKENTEDPNI